MKQMIANRPFRLSSRSMRGLDGAGARVERDEIVERVDRPEWNTSLVEVRTATGERGLAMIAWLDDYCPGCIVGDADPTKHICAALAMTYGRYPR